MRRIILIMVLIMVFSLAGMSSSIFADDIVRESFLGLNGVNVSIADISPNLEQAGLSKEQIRTDVELKLRLAGIKILTNEEWENEAGIPYIHVIVSANPGEGQKGLFCFCIIVQLRQAVRLIRNSSLMNVPTWGQMSYGIAGIEKIRPVIKDKVDQFINAYLSVNPKK